MASVNIPESSSTVDISIIDTTFDIKNIPTGVFFGPELKGFEKFNACAYGFLVTHTDATTGKQRRLVFDLGPPKDWENDLPPFLVNDVKGWGCDIEISKYVSEILEENGVPPDNLEAVVWSHPHWDHTGRVSLFPPNVKLITGPGVKTAYYPGYPTVANSTILERDFAGREVTELDFRGTSLQFGDFQALDYFGDGSLYFLSAPGHAIGHIVALARTTAASDHGAKSTFILMGGDSYHHGSMIRPNQYVPLPDNIPGPLRNLPQYANICPGHLFDVVHPSHPHRKSEIPPHYAEEIALNHSDPRSTPYFTISSTAEGKTVAHDLATARQTVKGLQLFDGDENILLIVAHDNDLYDIMDYFPKSANEWKAKGWKESGKWRFLGDLAKPVQIATEQPE